MKRLSDERWDELNEQLATGFDAQGVVLQRFGLTFETYFAEARVRATQAAPHATLPRLRESAPSNDAQGDSAALDEDSTGVTDTLEIDRRKLNQGVTPFVPGRFVPPKVAISEMDELGETAFLVAPSVEPPLPFKTKK